MVKKHIKIFNHLLRIIDSDNVYSINAICRAYIIQADRMPGRNVVERFYNTSEGKVLKDLKDDIARRTKIKEEVSLRALASTLVDRYFHNYGDEDAVADFAALEEMMDQFNSIGEYLLSFAIDRNTFSRFIEKNYVECKVPVTDQFLTLSTIHSAKGLEWKNVIIMGLSEGNFPNMWFARNKDEHGKAYYLNDLLKSMFVAATRTKGDLYLTFAQKNPWGYTQMPSRFLNSLQ